MTELPPTPADPQNSQTIRQIVAELERMIIDTSARTQTLRERLDTLDAMLSPSELKVLSDQITLLDQHLDVIKNFRISLQQTVEAGVAPPLPPHFLQQLLLSMQQDASPENMQQLATAWQHIIQQ